MYSSIVVKSFLSVIGFSPVYKRKAFLIVHRKAIIGGPEQGEPGISDDMDRDAGKHVGKTPLMAERLGEPFAIQERKDAWWNAAT